ncbi:MAG: phosphoribosylglycinamide formyltransferase [Myxococcaceae bacterium]
MMRVGVLASGSGSNFQALVEGLARGPHARVELLICNVPGAGALARAQQLGVPSVVLDHREFKSASGFDRAAFDAKLVATLREHRIELVCLAGYMRLVGPTVLRAFPGRVLNIHPALLPSFPGLHGVRQAIEAGVKVAGCTVHFVDEGTDTGPIIAQAAVKVLPGDDEDALAKRILVEEHRLYPAVVEALARADVRLEGRAVHLREAL